MYWGFQVWDIPTEDEKKEEVITEHTYADIDDLTKGEDDEDDESKK